MGGYYRSLWCPKRADLKIVFFWGFEMVFLRYPHMGFISLPKQYQRSGLESKNIGNPNHVIRGFFGLLFDFVILMNSALFCFPKVAIFFFS